LIEEVPKPKLEDDLVKIGSTVVAKAWKKYFSSSDHYTVEGSVRIKQIEFGAGKTLGQELTWHLFDVAPSCQGSVGDGACGIHIHEGTSCDEDPKGRYWNKTIVTDDPWQSVQYDSDSGGITKIFRHNAITVVTGTASIMGKAVIMHDRSRPPRGIACALIEEEPEPEIVKLNSTMVAKTWMKYFNSSTTFTVTGSVSITQIESGANRTAGQQLTWDLLGLDPACWQGSGNQCGIHIHKGSSCEEDTQGSHWDQTKVPDDPWTALQYDADDKGGSKETNVHTIVTGTSDISGKTIVVYDSTAPGRRIACALIEKHGQPPKLAELSGAMAVAFDAQVLMTVLTGCLLLVGQRR